MDGKEIVYLQLEDIIPNRFQPREVFDEQSLKELAVSIKEHGVIQPIIVRKVEDKYEIIAGERRYKAAELAGLKKIPAIVRDLEDKEATKVALLENLQRKNLNPMEEARTYQKILDLDEMTQEELAENMGKSQSAVANKLRLLALPKKVQEALMNEQISERHARALLNLEDDQKKEELLNKIISTRMTVRELEKEINAMNNKSNDTKDLLEENLPEVPIEENKQPEKPEQPVQVETPEPSKDIEIPDVMDLPVTENVKPEGNIDLGVNTFINQDPIIPEEEKKEKKEFGEVTVAPPEGETQTQSNLPKFINYGEIDDDEDDSNDEDTKNLGTSTSIDLDDLKMNTEDINTEEPKKERDLDDLLKIDNSASINPEEMGEEKEASFKFINPADEEEEKPKEAEQKIIDNPMDYFTSPDVIPTEHSTEEFTEQPETPTGDNSGSALDQALNVASDNKEEHKKFDENGDFIEDDEKLPEVSVDAPAEKPYIYVPDSIKDKAALTSILMSDGISRPEEQQTETLSLKDAISEIRKTISNLEKKNVDLESEEIDLPNNYQINIKIRKDE